MIFVVGSLYHFFNNTYSRADANDCVVIVSTIFDFVLCFTIDYRKSSVFFEVVVHGRKFLAQNLEKSD